MKGRKRGRDTHAFWLSLGLSLFVFLTGAGLLAVDYQGRKLSFGDSTPPLQVDRLPDRTLLEIKAFGVDSAVDVTALDDFFCFLWDFACLPHR